jgi:predicted phosphate transport protein (TIGR00153 family)
MARVAECVHKMSDLYEAHREGDQNKVEALAEEISNLEHLADLEKNEIRNNLPKGIFLAVNRADLLDILSLQDTIADKAEDIAFLLTLKKMDPIEEIDEDLRAFIGKNIETVDYAHNVLKQMDELLETSFGGKEADLVVQMVERVAFLEHEADKLQATLLKKMFRMEKEMPYTSFYLWMTILKTTAALSNTAEKLANKVRMLLEVS